MDTVHFSVQETEKKMRPDRAQEEAAAHFRGPCMVLSGPGSGKTTVITRRVRMLVEERGVSPEQILVVTFTRAAAEEMKNRFLRLVSAAKTAVLFGTFHSVFYMILRQESFPDVLTVVEGRERMELLREALSRTDPGMEPDQDYLRALSAEISRVKNAGGVISPNGPGKGRIDFKGLYEAYNALLRKRNAMDYDDMLLRTRELFRERPEVLRTWRERFRFILIDEFQDVNRVQYEIVKMLMPSGEGLFVVGDDDQSIYGFRGADPRIMLAFPKDFPGTRTILLGQNYRSAGEIVQASLSLVEHNRDRYRKKLQAADRGARKGLVEFRRFENISEECTWIADAVLRRAEEGLPLHEMAVLTRTAFGAEAIVQKCIERGIPFVSRDQVPNLFAHFAVRPVFACLNWAAGNRTRANLLRFLFAPPRGIRREDLTEDPVDLEAVSQRLSNNPETRWRAEHAAFFLYQTQLLRRLAVPYAMINYFRKGMGYDEYVCTQAEKKGMDPQGILAVLDWVQESAKNYRRVQDFYSFVAKYVRMLEEKSRTETVRDRLVISTLHGAKGLEYSEVFIPDLCELILPHEKASTREDVEEERRMLYVGMTRAKDALHLFTVKERFGRSMQESRFLREIKRP
jgi:DNA helicase-2/ATP-dependent DNA helicase PcrA